MCTTFLYLVYFTLLNLKIKRALVHFCGGFVHLNWHAFGPPMDGGDAIRELLDLIMRLWRLIPRKAGADFLEGAG